MWYGVGEDYGFGKLLARIDLSVRLRFCLQRRAGRGNKEAYRRDGKGSRSDRERSRVIGFGVNERQSDVKWSPANNCSMRHGWQHVRLYRR